MKRILTFLGCVLIFLLGACANMKDKSQMDKATAKSSREMRFIEAKKLVEKMATLSDQRAWFDLSLNCGWVNTVRGRPACHPCGSRNTA